MLPYKYPTNQDTQEEPSPSELTQANESKISPKKPLHAATEADVDDDDNDDEARDSLQTLSTVTLYVFLVILSILSPLPWYRIWQGAPQTTLFVKNLNFSTTTDALREHFQTEVVCAFASSIFPICVL